MATVITAPGYTGVGVKHPLGYGGAGWTEPRGQKLLRYGRAGTTVVTRPSLKAAVAGKATAGAAPVNGQQWLMKLLGTYIGQIPSPAQKRADAAKSVQSQIDIALAGMRASTKAEQEYANRQALRAKGFSEALASLGPSDARQIAALYNDAAGHVSALGTGLTGAVADAEKGQAAQTQQDVQNTTGGLGQLGGYDPDALRNVAQYTGVVRPSQDLAEEAANQGAFAQYRASTDAGHIQNIMNDYLSQANLAQDKLGDQRAALESTRPALYQQALSALDTGSRSDIATMIQGLGLANTYSQTPGKIAQTAAETAATTSGATVKSATAAHLLPNGNLDTTKYYWSTPDAKTRIPLTIPRHQMIDPHDPTHTRVIPNPADPPANHHFDPKTGTFVLNPKSGAGAKKGTTVTQVSSMIRDLNKLDPTVYAKATRPPVIAKTTGQVYEPTMTWDEAYNQLLGTFPADVRKQSRVKTAVANYLIRYGYSRPVLKSGPPAPGKTAAGPV